MNDLEEFSEPDDDTIFVERPTGFEQIPDAVWVGGACSTGAVVMYLALSRRGSRGDRGIPKRRTLAADQGVSLRTVDARIDELVAKGWLLVTQRFREYGDRQQSSNHYRLLWTPVIDERDPRLIAHRAAAARFEKEMNARKVAKTKAAAAAALDAERGVAVRSKTPRTPSQKTARGVGAESCEGGVQKTATRPSQNPAHQEPDLLKTTPSLTDLGLTRRARAAGEVGSGRVRSIDNQTPAPPSTPPRVEYFEGVLLDDLISGVLPAALRVTTRTAQAHLREVFEPLLEAGWTVADLARTITATPLPEEIKSPVGLIKHRLSDLAARPPVTARAAGEKPPWCGECEEIDRSRETEAGPIVRCPVCHPLSNTG